MLRKRKNKILLLLTLVMVLAFGSVAMADIIRCNGEEYEVPSFKEYVPDGYGCTIIGYESNKYFYYFLFVYDMNMPLYWGLSDSSASNDGDYCMATYPTGAVDYTKKYSYYEYCVKDSWNSGGWAIKSDKARSFHTCSENSILYTTCDVYDYRDSSVFYQAPKVGALRPILEQAEVKKNLGGTLLEAISLMPLVLSVVISYLALRKGYRAFLQMLSTA